MVLSFFVYGCVTYLSECQCDNYLCLLLSAAGVGGYVIER